MSDHARLASAIDQRRLELRLSWSQLAKRVGLSESGLGNIRRGRNGPSPLTKRRIEVALSWAPGSIDAALDGGEPTVYGGEEQAAFDIGGVLDDDRLSVMLRVVDHRLLLAELARRLDGAAPATEPAPAGS